MLISVCLEMVLSLTQVRRMVPNVHYAQKSFWMHPMEFLGDVGHVKPRFDPFRDHVSAGAT